MANDLVVKTNRLNMVLQNLTLPEIRIIQLAIVDARETGRGLSADTPLRIDALRYAEAFDTTRQNAYARMKEAEETLFNRRFSFTDEKNTPIKSRWVSQARYLDEEGAIELIFTPAVVQGISRIDGAEQYFTQYLLNETAKLTSVYAVRLYELLAQWKGAGKTPVFDLATFRGQMGLLDGEYRAMNDFKKRVLDLAVDEITEKTDITVTYTQKKRGRLVSGFQFAMKPKEKSRKEKEAEIFSDFQKLNFNRDKNTPDLFHKMTEAQIALYSRKLATLPELGGYAPKGALEAEYVQIIANELRNSEKQAKYQKYLEKVGYVMPKK